MSSTVSIVKVDYSNIYDSVCRAFQLAGGSQVIKRSARVLIKPNLCIPAPPGSGMVTDARVTGAVARLVLELGAKPVIGEGAAAGYDFVGSYSTEEAFRVSGTEAVARKMDVELRNLNTDRSVEIPIQGGLVMDRVTVARSALEFDHIISVPVLKSHHRTLASLSLKNMKGILSGEEKRKTHRLGLDLGIADINSVIRPDFTIVDSLTGLEGLWHYPEDSVPLGLLLAGQSPLAVDTVGIRLMGLNPDQAMHLEYCCRRDGFDKKDVKVVGEPIEPLRRLFLSSADAFLHRFPGVTLIQGRRACSGCIGQLIGALAQIRAVGLEQTLGGLNLAVGAPFPQEIEANKILYVGICCKQEAGQGIYVPGCPPREEALLRQLGVVCGFESQPVLTRRDTERQKVWNKTRELLNR